MKFTVSTAVSALVVAMVTFTQVTEAQSTCPAQTVFDQCKQNEDNYLNTCKQLDYACLCKWQTAKVSCWDTCPDDIERSTQAALMTTYCSQPGANVTVPASSSMAPPASQTSIAQASSTPSSPASGKGDGSAASSLLTEGNIFYVAGSAAALVAGYMLQ
ncbi:hypothetical protein BDA99DRAFT_281032 [Phascolomyces articulosus]|uniref:GPI anchored serine-threonine rich protein n=1 Tax=Phascolomyces articulosus TaxID=60185 RepID=A0AAD5KJW2_9FUNG|nr:hypothetical protein BDA99DRAFT_281032 [Phascolomyces articulosus]